MDNQQSTDEEKFLSTILIFSLVRYENFFNVATKINTSECSRLKTKKKNVYRFIRNSRHFLCKESAANLAWKNTM